MVQRVTPVAFEGHRDSDRRRPGAVAPGMPAFTIVGPPDKAAFEARERVRSAMIASGLALAARRITINLALAYPRKRTATPTCESRSGSWPQSAASSNDALSGFAVLGGARPQRLDHSGRRRPVCRHRRNARGEGLICPAAYGPKRHGRAPKSRSSRLHRSFNSRTTSRARGRCHGRSPKSSKPREPRPILRHPGPGERQAALDVPAAGGHNLLTVGPPGAGKSMLASRLPDPAAAGRPNSSKSPWSPPSPVSFEGGALTHRFSLLREAANDAAFRARIPSRAPRRAHAPIKRRWRRGSPRACRSRKEIHAASRRGPGTHPTCGS